MRYSNDLTINPDLARERENSKLDIEELNSFLGQYLFGSVENYRKFMQIRNDLVRTVRPLYEENFYNLDRNEKYEAIFGKTTEIYQFIKDRNLNKQDLVHFYRLQVVGAVMGYEKVTFFLHQTFISCIELWGTDEQTAYWTKLMSENMIFGTYIQTELGHGTFVRGLETTATYERQTREFILHSPTITSIKFWPGTAGLSSNFGLVMAKLIIDNKDYGVQAFVVQLRSLENHRLLEGIETGDIGRKMGLEPADNGYVKFTHHRIPRMNMLMRYAHVDENGHFDKRGNEVVMYASMLTLRVQLACVASTLLSMSTTIAIRYSAVRRQTSNSDGIEPQIVDYQTQQIRLFPSLAATYGYYFASAQLYQMLAAYRTSTNNFATSQATELGRFHAIASGLKAQSFNVFLKFAQSNRLCCGGHGFSMSSGLPQCIQEADAGCTYEGDNVVLLLQTARYLLKCEQKNAQPHVFQVSNSTTSCPIVRRFQIYFDLFYKLYNSLIGEVSNKMRGLITEAGLDETTAWNMSSTQLVNVAKLFITIFVFECNLSAVTSNRIEVNRNALADLLELFVLYELAEVHAASFLRLNLVDSRKIDDLNELLLSLLPKIRTNCVAFVDAFDYLDSNLCSSLGAYDGNVYERLYEFAKNSKYNKTEVHPAYEKYMKPFIRKQISKL